MDFFYQLILPWLAFIACSCCGWMIKVLEKVIALREGGQKITLIRYLLEDRYRIAISIIGAAVLLVIANELSQLNYMTAIAIGYVGESASRFLRQIADKRLNA